MENMFVRKIVVLATLFTVLISVNFAQTTVSHGVKQPVTSALKKIRGYVKTKEGMAVAIFSAMYIRLKTKGSAWDYKLSDWREDLEKLLSCCNVFDTDSYKTVVRLFDKWVVGREFSLYEISFEEVNKDGREQKVKSSRIASKPFGLLGLFDAYVIQLLKKFAENFDNMGKIQKGFETLATLEQAI